jgi:hypothetical protein
MIDTTASGMEIRSALDGHVVASVPGPLAWFTIASDGSYVATGTNSALTVYSTTTGSVLQTLQGNYSTAAVFAAPAQVQIAMGPAGANVIQTLNVSSGATTNGAAFSGTFQVWFGDGSHFLTSLGNAVWTYTAGSTQADITQVSQVGSLGGWGQYFWNYNFGDVGTPLYQVGSSTSAAATLGIPYVPSGPTIGEFSVIPSSNLFDKVTVVDLSGSTIATTSYVPKTAHPPSLAAYGTTSATSWLIGDDWGVILDGSNAPTSQEWQGGVTSAPARFLTQGSALTMAGGTTYFAVATAAGQTFVYDSSSFALVTTINQTSSGFVASRDGTVLVAMGDFTNPERGLGLLQSSEEPLNVYSLPTGTVVETLDYVYGGIPTPATGIALSGSGTVLALNSDSRNTQCGWDTTMIGASTPIYCAPSGSQIAGVLLSPDGTLNTATSGTAGTPYTTSIFKNGALSTAVPGLSVGWLDNGRLLAQIYTPSYTSSAIYDPSGNVLATPPLPQLHSVADLPWILPTGNTDTFYSPGLNQILSLTTGLPTWASGEPSTGVSAVTGSNVVFVSGSLVLAQPYPAM